MHDAFITRTNGTSSTLQILLFILFQIITSDGRVTNKRIPSIPRLLYRLRPAQLPHIPPRLFPLHPAQENNTKTGPMVSDVTPHVQDLGFFPRGNITQNLEDVRRRLPEIMNRSRIQEAENNRIWHDMMMKKFKNSVDGHRQWDNMSSQQNTSSQLGIPHLDRLGFGVSNNSPLLGNGDNGERRNVHSGLDRDSALSNLHHTIVVGVGSFLGGMLVIILLLIVVLLRRRRLLQHRLRRDVESNPDDPKLTLLHNEAGPPVANLIEELTNELSSSSYASTHSSTSSGSGETASQTSDTSHNSDLWHSPDHIAMTALCQRNHSMVHNQTMKEHGTSSSSGGHTDGELLGACGTSSTVSSVAFPDIVDMNTSPVTKTLANQSNPQGNGSSIHTHDIAMDMLHHAGQVHSFTPQVTPSGSLSLNTTLFSNDLSPTSSFSFPDRNFNSPHPDNSSTHSTKISPSPILPSSGAFEYPSPPNLPETRCREPSYKTSSPIPHRKSSCPIQEDYQHSPKTLSYSGIDEAPHTSMRNFSCPVLGNSFESTMTLTASNNEPLSGRRSPAPRPRKISFQTLDSCSDHTDSPGIIFSANSPSPFSFGTPPFNYRTSTPPSPIIIRRASETSNNSNSSPQRCFANTMPDLLLRCKLKSKNHQLDQSPATFNQSSRKVSDDGGILSCCGGDIVAIVPPGAVQVEHTFNVSTVTDESTVTSIKSKPNEHLVSPVVEVTSANITTFMKPITIKLPFRAVSSTEGRDCHCQDDPLCGCRRSSLVLRYWDKSTSSWRPTEYKTGNYGMVSHYTWPECLNPEPDDHGMDPGYPQPNVTYNFFKNMCTLQTNTLGTFCVTSYLAEPILTSPNRLMTPLGHQGTIAKMCMTISAVCQLSTRETAGMPMSQLRRSSSGTSCNWRGFDGSGSVSSVQQITYTVHICDNTIIGRKIIQEVIRSSGGQQQCVCIPLDIPVQSEVKVTLTSVRDSDWLWVMSPDSPSSKVVPWKDFCDDYGTLIQAEFRCLPRNADVTITPDDNMSTGFQVDAENVIQDRLDTVSVKLLASNRYNS